MTAMTESKEAVNNLYQFTSKVFEETSNCGAHGLFDFECHCSKMRSDYDITHNWQKLPDAICIHEKKSSSTILKSECTPNQKKKNETKQTLMRALGTTRKLELK